MKELFIIFLLSLNAAAHKGDTNPVGCHYDAKKDRYHCHPRKPQ